MNINKKELYRQFEFSRLIFDGVDTPEGIESEDVAKTIENLAAEAARAAESLTASQAMAEKQDATAKTECDANVNQCQTDRSRLDEGGTESPDTPPVQDGTPSSPDNINPVTTVSAAAEGYAEANGQPEATTPTKEKTTASPDQVAESLFNDRDLRLALLEFMAPDKDANQIDQATFTEMLKSNELLAKVITNVKLDENGELQMDDKGREAFAKGIDKAFGIEGAKMTTVEEMKRVGGIKFGKKTFEEVYGRDAVQLFAMKYATRTNKEGVAEVKEGENWVALDQKTIARLLPKDISEAFAKEGGQEAYKKLVEGRVKSMQSAIALRDMIRGGNEGGNNALATLAEQFKSYLQLIQMLKQAMETQNFDDFTDALNDVKNHRNPADTMKAAKNEYEKQVASISDLKTLLDMHANPNAGEANRLFGTGDNRIPYRSALKGVIEGKLLSNLGVGAKILESKNENGVASLRLEQNGKQYQLNLTPGDAFTKANLVEVTVVDGRETFGQPLEGNLTDLQGAGDSSLEGLMASYKNGLRSGSESVMAQNQSTPEGEIPPAEEDATPETPAQPNA